MSPPAQSPRVAVIGAGPAGLAAAWRLREAGLSVQVLEAADGPGGRTRYEVVDGLTLEPGGHALYDADRWVRALASSAGLGDELVAPAPSGMGQVVDGAIVPVAAERRFGLPGPPLAVPGLRWHEAWRLLRLPRLVNRFADVLDPSAPERATRLDDRSLADFARLYFGRRVLEQGAAAFLGTDAPCDAAETSRLLFMLRWHTHRSARPLQLRWGLGALARALAAQVDVRYGFRVERIERDAGGLVVVRAGEDEPTSLRADAVVAAVPAEGLGALAPSLFTDAERRFFAGARSAPALGVSVATGRRFERRFHRIRIPRSEGWPLDTLTCGGGTGDDRRGLIVAVSGEHYAQQRMDAPDEAVAKEVVDVLDRLYPGLRAAVSFTRVHRFPQARPRFDVGRFRALAQLRRNEAAERARGRRLYFAGDWTAGPWVESALRSGVRAADAVLADGA